VKCLVSGATGFIGRQLCQHLAAGGHTVVALSKHGGPLASGEPTLALDLTRHDPEPGLLHGVDALFHLAGIAHQRARPVDYEELNTEATLRLARLASAAGIRCFIFLSSVKAMGPPPTAAVRAESACTPPLDAYGRSKRRAECALQEQFTEGPMSVVIVRPTLVYGSDVKGNLQLLARAVRLGLPRPPLGGSRSMIALADLVDLLCLIAQCPPPAGVHTWIACGPDSYTTQGIYDLMRVARGMGRGSSWWPSWVWRLAASLLDLALGQREESTFEKLFGTELYSNAAVLEGTQWRPRTRLEDVIPQIAGAGIPAA
jgi:nucleoside-diphosphate-sugar epimerase